MAESITEILQKVTSGDPRAADEPLPLVYDQLRAAAQKQMARERPDHTLQATALVHEAYVRLVGNQELSWENRAHFYVAAAEAMRRVLIEHARKRGREKRGGMFDDYNTQFLRCSSRSSAPPTSRLLIGFRVARTFP